MKISIDLIDFPSFDLRFYRNKQFFSMLLKDIEQSGILVRPIVQKLSNGRFLLIDGINRVKCAKRLCWNSVDCDVISDLDEIEAIIKGLKINLKRSSHDPVGVSETFKRLRDLGLSQKEIARRFGFSKAHVSKLISLTRLSAQNKLKLAKGELSIPQAYALVKKPRDPELLESLGVKYLCETCRTKVSFSLIETIQLCSDCKSKLLNLIRSEKKKAETEKTQAELPL